MLQYASSCMGGWVMVCVLLMVGVWCIVGMGPLRTSAKLKNAGVRGGIDIYYYHLKDHFS